LLAVRNDGAINLSTFVYGNTVNTSPRTLYIESGTGSLGGISSIRASKKNIQDIENVDWIYQLNPVTFNYRKKDENGNYTDESHDELFYGLIAEDTEPIADFLVNYNDKEDGSKEMAGIEYMRLITPMLKAIQELKAQIEELSNKIVALESK
jgi:lipopolysaccharide export LptBFGC system permease protein LptF